MQDAALAARANIETLRGALGDGLGAATMTPAASTLDALESHPDLQSSPDRARLVAAVRHLRALDRAICDRARELGATVLAG